LEEGEADDEGSLADMINLTREDSEEESRSDKATELEPFTSDDVDREERKVVAWQETESGDDDLQRASVKRVLFKVVGCGTYVTGSELEELVKSVTGLATIPDLSQHDTLVQLRKSANSNKT
jgi:hypothetical protein